jgi:hypothetical protein
MERNAFVFMDQWEGIQGGRKGSKRVGYRTFENEDTMFLQNIGTH